MKRKNTILRYTYDFRQGSEVVVRAERNEKTTTLTTKRIIRFPTDEEIVEFLDEALPMAQKEAAIHGLEVEDWMIAEAICQICPEIEQCDQQRLIQAVNRVIQRQID